jgi:hypothetical protein
MILAVKPKASMPNIVKCAEQEIEKIKNEKLKGYHGRGCCLWESLAENKGVGGQRRLEDNN